MINCEQFRGQTVFQHGQSVRALACELIDSLRNNSSLEGWRIPKWCFEPLILQNLHNQETIDLYTLFHDCGKPFCRIEDAEGKVHFPNHAETSRQVFLEVTGNETVANLIGWDMDLHLKNATEIAEACQIWSVKDACTLLIVALSELHSNARFLDPLGIESQSFKIKWKQLDRRGSQVCKFYFKD